MAVLISLLAVHQLLKDAVQFVKVSVAGDESLRLKASTGNQVQRLAADCRGVMEGGAERDVTVVNAIGVESDVCSQRASAKKIYRAAFADEFDSLLPGLRHADSFDSNIDAAIFRGQSARIRDGLANAGGLHHVRGAQLASRFNLAVVLDDGDDFATS